MYKNTVVVITVMNACLRTSAVPAATAESAY